MLRISDTNNVIIQHIRTRPGDFYTGGPSGPPTGYQPDSIWISNSSDVILDHVSASWSTDEVLSTSHNSDRVTVQWALISEALHNSNHASGNHGYGSIIDGRRISYHHNLYAHNRSRNPRAGGQNTVADFVNNVIFNAGDRYGYGGNDNMDINLIGNFGIDGPNTSSNRSLFHGGSANTRVFVDDNLMDRNRNGLLDLTPAGSTTLSGTYSVNNTPVSASNVPVNATDAATAYVQVLSYAGSSARRDPIDQRVINTVIRQNGAHIDSQEQVGGWYHPASTTVHLDADGLPDWWKLKQGLDPSDETIGRQKPVPGGYTYLEMYLHELNAPFLPRSESAEIVVSTAFGHGADTTLSESDGAAGGSGAGHSLTAVWNNFDRNEVTQLRFDLSAVAAGSIGNARLELTAYDTMSNHTLRVYGLANSAAGQDWNEAEAAFGNSPGLVFDGNSATRGRAEHELLLLGEFSTTAAAEGDIVGFTNPNLGVFLNHLMYRGSGSDSLATLLIERQDNSNSPSLFASKEAEQLATGFPAEPGAYAPRLVLDAVPDTTLLPGDYNHDGIVNAADYVVWRNGVSSGEFTVDDYAQWRAHFGEILAANSLDDAGASIPEPSSFLLMLIACWRIVRLPQRS
jgi:hypothetical protein